MNRDDLISLAKGAAIAAAGAVVAYLANVAIPQLQASGDVVLLGLAALASVAVNALRKKFFPNL